MSQAPLYSSCPSMLSSQEMSDQKVVVKTGEECTSVAGSGAQHLWEGVFRICWRWKRMTQ